MEEQYRKDNQLKRRDVVKLMEWQRLQPHLPAPLHPIELALPLHGSFYNNEMAKQLIDTYYTFRTHCPQFFANRDPFEPELQQALETYLITILPHLTPEGYIVMYCRLLDRNPNVFNLDAGVKVADMICELTLKHQGCYKGYVGIVDVEGATFSHVLKANLLSVKRLLDYVQTALPIRLKSMHIVNGVSFVDKILAIIRTFFAKEMLDLLHVHFGDNASIFKYVPKNILPIECGGSSFCALDYYREITRKEIEKHSDYFKLAQNLVVDESKRPLNLKTRSHSIEVQGTFKQLLID